jgi:hypothetical protein
VRSNVAADEIGDLTFTDINGNDATLKDYLGKKHVVPIVTLGFNGSVCLCCSTPTSRKLTNYAKLSQRVTEVMLRNDLGAAGIPYQTDAGIADFHSLRHTFISNLAAGGVPPKLAQQLARHSTITLTMDRYSHVGLLDLNAALESLPVVTAPESQEMRATGTTDEHAADFSCIESCKRPAENTPFQPLSTVSMSTSDETLEMQKTPQKHAVSTKFSQARPEGFDSPRRNRGKSGVRPLRRRAFRRAG